MLSSSSERAEEQLVMRELLFALSGWAGSVFRIDDEQGGGAPRFVRSSLHTDLLAASTNAQIDEFLVLATYCYRIEQRAGVLSDRSKSTIYQNLLGSCLQSILLRYRSDLEKIEADVRKEAIVAFTMLRVKIDTLWSMMESLSHILDRIFDHGASGPNIYSFFCINKQFNPIFVKSIKRQFDDLLIREIAYLVYFNVIESDEFFIQRCDSAENRTRPLLLNTELLPCSISIEMAEMILFIGTYSDIFDKSVEEVFGGRRDELAAAFMKISADSIKEDEEIYSVVAAHLDETKRIVAKNLWEHVMRRSNLVEEMGRVRDLMLMARGDVWSAFLGATSELLAKSNRRKSKDLSVSFECVVDEFDDCAIDLSRFKLTIVADSAEKMSANWRKVSARIVAPDSPLMKLLFNDDALALYSEVFQYLFRLTYASHRLLEQSTTLLTANQPKVYALFRTMHCVSQKLLNYIHAIVIDDKFKTFLDGFVDARERDFEQVLLAHQRYLKEVKIESCVGDKQIQQLVDQLCGQMVSLSDLMESPGNIDLFEEIKLQWTTSLHFLEVRIASLCRSNRLNRYYQLLQSTLFTNMPQIASNDKENSRAINQ